MQCYYLRRITYYSGYSSAEELIRSGKNILSVSTKKYNEKNAKKSLQKKSDVYVADSVVIFGNITKKHECFLRTITNFAKNVKQT